MKSCILLSLLQTCLVAALPRAGLRRPWSPVLHADMKFYYPSSAPPVYEVVSESPAVPTVLTTQVLFAATSAVSIEVQTIPVATPIVSPVAVPSQQMLPPPSAPTVILYSPIPSSGAVQVSSVGVSPVVSTSFPPPVVSTSVPPPVFTPPVVSTSVPPPVFTPPVVSTSVVPPPVVSISVPPPVVTPSPSEPAPPRIPPPQSPKAPKPHRRPQAPPPPAPEIPDVSSTSILVVSTPPAAEIPAPQVPETPAVPMPSTSDVASPLPETESRIMSPVVPDSTSTVVLHLTSTSTVFATSTLGSSFPSPVLSSVIITSAPTLSLPPVYPSVGLGTSSPSSQLPIFSSVPVSSFPAVPTSSGLSSSLENSPKPSHPGPGKPGKGRPGKGKPGKGKPGKPEKPHKPGKHQEPGNDHGPGKPQKPGKPAGNGQEGHAGHQGKGSGKGQEFESTVWDTTVWVTDEVTYTDYVPCSTIYEVITTKGFTYTTTYTVTGPFPTFYPPASQVHPNPGPAFPQPTNSPHDVHAHQPPITVPSSTFRQSVITVAPSSTVTLETTLTTSEVQTITVKTTVTQSTTVLTRLETSGRNTQMPINTTVVPTQSSMIQPITAGPNAISSTTEVRPTIAMSNNIFVSATNGAPVPQITDRSDHPVQPEGIDDQEGPIQTNKFYAGFFLGDRTAPTWTHPYSLSWNKGGGVTSSWGIAVSHIERSQVVYGPGDPPSYYVNPGGLQAFVLSARELGPTTSLTMSDLEGFSANVNLAVIDGANPTITFPLVQGMGFVTGVYNTGTPLLQSSISFRSLVYDGAVSGKVVRYSVALNDGSTWFIYISPSGSTKAPTLTLADSTTIAGNRRFTGTIQVAKLPSGSTASSIYDSSAGVYPVSGVISASVSGSIGQYSLSWSKSGLTSKKLLMFALPHHVQSFSSQTASAMKMGLQLMTTTKGLSTAVVSDSWIMVEENLPIDMGFAPWSPTLRNQDKLPKAVLPLLRRVAGVELNENFTAQTDLDSMYFSGKALAKFAAMVYTANDLAKSPGLASAGLVKLKDSFARFVNNQQIFPLVYDTVWGGVVSSATYVNGDQGADFGNTLYNDHHFHYGYFVYTAAVIAYLDPSWLRQGSNLAWVNTLVRDYANPVSDGYFPFSRMFDWFHGHSWAHGIIETFDGKDQESSSEDGFASYAIKMWGKVVGDPNMEARGNLMLAVQGRTFMNYYLMQDSNTVQPPSFVPNKAAGIIFENKIDHTTYFGTNIEYIEGIHMLPLNPSSTLTRAAPFVRQEWDTYFSNGRADAVEGGWRGILYANLAIVDPRTAYNFFASPSFSNEWLDGGASRTWYLAFCAGLGGAR